MPKYPHIKATLKARLLAGKYREGEPIPSESQVASEFKVSRMTARRAVDELEREGYVYRVQGAGSYPTGKRFRQGVFRIRSLEELALELPDQPLPFTKVLKAGISTATPKVTDALRIPPNTAILEIIRLRGLGDLPVLLEKRFLKLEQTEDILKTDLRVESLHDTLVGTLGLSISRVEQTLETANLEYENAKLLELPVGTSAFLMKRISFSGDLPLAYTRYWVRSDRRAFVSVFEP
jgi:DNA-binding GntR family transcriptional regulator